MVSVCVCTHQPQREILRACLEALRALVIPDEGLELVVIDNASPVALSEAELGLAGFPYPARLVREPVLGLSHARLRASREARGGVVVLADDDNYLHPGYAVAVSRLFRECPRAGIAGGICWPKFGALPPAWFEDVAEALAIRNYGPNRRCISAEPDKSLAGAGLSIRIEAFHQAVGTPLLLEDRKGRKLSSGGDTELAVRIGLMGWESWYEPAMQLEHFLPAGRLQPDYLERLYEGFGVAMGSIDLYSGFRPPLPALWFLRRAWYHRRQSWADARAAARAGGEREQVRFRLGSAFHRGRSRGLASLALARHWQRVVQPFVARSRVPTVDPDRQLTAADRGCISVVIPTYNRAHYLGEAVSSVIAQGDAVGEIVVVDDGSTDNTEAVLAAIGDPRIRLVKQANRGPAVARNHGWQVARGEFVQFLDSDDVLPQGTSSRMLATARRHPGHVVYGGVTYHGSDVWGPVCASGAIAERSGRILGEVSRMSFGTIFASLIPREALGRIGGFEMPEEVQPCEDFDFALRLALTYPFVREPGICYRVRLHESNRHTTLLEPMHEARLASVRRLVPASPGLLALKLQAQAFHAGLLADRQLARGAHRQAALGYLRCLAWWPLKLRAYGSLIVALVRLFAGRPAPLEAEQFPT